MASSAPDGNGPQAQASSQSYESWSRVGAAATRQGDFGSALEAYRTALRMAEAEGEPEREEAASLNVAMVLLQMGAAREGEEGLREILLRTSDAQVAFTAAYHLASSLRKQSRHERALAYAQRAMERARTLGTADYLAPAHNLLGNIHLSQSYLDQALTEYRCSLALRQAQPGDTRYSRAILLENIGYCLLQRRQIAEGLDHIRTALELAQEVQDLRCRAECLQDLCYGLLLDGKLPQAMALGADALEAAQRSGYVDIAENCHYLLGEIGTQSGNLEMRDAHLDQLQAMHPELPFLKDFLCAVDVMSIITLKR